MLQDFHSTHTFSLHCGVKFVFDLQMKISPLTFTLFRNTDAILNQIFVLSLGYHLSDSFLCKRIGKQIQEY